MPKYITKQRKILLEYLSTCSDEPVSVKRIAYDLSDKKLSLSSVYRNVVELENEGRLRRMNQNGSHEILYQYIDTDECYNHLHLSCKMCGSITHLSNDEADALVKEVSETIGFQINKNDTVLYGICKKCLNYEKNGEE